MKSFIYLIAAAVIALALSAVTVAENGNRLVSSTRGGQMMSEPLSREVDISNIPQATGAEITSRVQMLRPRDGRTDAQYAEMKRQAALLGGSVPSISAQPAPALRSADLTLTHAFFGQGESCCTPSDMAIAVNNTFVVQFVNTFIAVYSKTGVLQTGYPKAATTFFGLPAGTYTTDPRGFYDWTNGRFVFVMLTESSFSSNNVGQLLVAVSATSNPTGTWHLFSFQVGNTGECPDYPTLGHDSNNWGKNATKGAIYIGINQFSNNCNGGFIQNYMFVLLKDGLYSGLAFHGWQEFGFNFGGTLVDTLQPSNPQGAGDRPSAEYLTHTFNILWNCGSGCSGLGLWSINNVAAFSTGGPGPNFAGIFVPTAHTYFYPPSANQPGASNSIETIDVRITASMYYHAGDLWGTFETGVPSVSGAHPIWFDYHPKLDGNGNIAGGDERQEDCFVCGGQGTNGSAYFSALVPDSDNNVTMTYTYSDDATFPEMALTGRRVSFGDTFMNGVGFALVGGSGLYSQFRWGDYAAVAPDNSKASLPEVWTAGDFDNGGSWGTVISEQDYAKPTDQ